jgi:hypothetical protein
MGSRKAEDPGGSARQLEVLELRLGLRLKLLLVLTWTSKFRVHSTLGTFDQIVCRHEWRQCDRGRWASSQETRLARGKAVVSGGWSSPRPQLSIPRREESARCGGAREAQGR